MEIARFTDDQLHESCLNTARKEREFTALLLEHLVEVEARKLYAKRGFSSLWEYVVKDLGYEGGAAQRRIQAARFLRSVPETREALQKEEVSVTTVSLLQRFIKTEKTRNQKNYSVQEKKDLLEQSKGKTSRQIERELCKIAPDFNVKETLRPVAPDRNEVTLILSEQDVRNLERLGELFSRANPGITRSELVSKAITQAVERAEKLLQPQQNAAPIRTARKWNHTRSRYISRNTVREIFQKSDEQCTYIDPKTRHRCSARRGLQVDHIFPFAKGGGNEAQNLTVLCGTHNRLRGVQEFGGRAFRTSQLKIDGNRNKVNMGKDLSLNCDKLTEVRVRDARPKIEKHLRSHRGFKP